MLLCVRSRAWKITDFGLTFEGTSRRAYSTSSARGTDGYRAPELVRHGSVFSKETDIFSVGCIFFELISDKKLFLNDYDVFNYGVTRHSIELPRLDLDLDKRMQRYLVLLINAMLEIDWWKRPSASDILRILQLLSEKSTEVCLPKLNQQLDSYDNSNTCRESFIILTLSHDDKLWEQVWWRPYW